MGSAFTRPTSGGLYMIEHDFQNSENRKKIKSNLSTEHIVVKDQKQLL